MLIKTSQPLQSKPSKLHVLITDSSGSMHWAIKALQAELKSRSIGINPGDAVLMGNFSGPKDFVWTFSSEIHTDEDLNRFEQSIDLLNARGLTCLSEILQDLPNQLVRYQSKYPIVSLVFMSDGQPTVGSYEVEVSKTIEACKALSKIISFGTVISFGNYADKKLLKSMANALQAEFVLAQNTGEIGQELDKNFESGSLVKVKPKKSGNLMLAVSEKGIRRVTDKARLEEGVWDVEESLEETPLYLKAYYYAASDLPLSLSILRELGDTYLIDLLSEGLTPKDLKKAIEAVKEACLNPDKRYRNGKEVGYITPANKPNILILLKLLVEKEASIIYGHPAFKYSPIGRLPEKNENDLKFVPEPKIQPIKVNDLVGNEEALNVSLMFTIKGYVNIGSNSLNLPENIDTHIYRNYSIIFNGHRNVDSLVISGSNAISALVAEGYGHIITIDPDNPNYFILDLTQLSVCNLGWADSIPLGECADIWTAMGSVAQSIVDYKAVIKVVKQRLDELDQSKSRYDTVDYSTEQLEYLSSLGFRKEPGGLNFSPKRVLADPVDEVTITVAKIKVPLSSLPKIDRNLKPNNRINKIILEDIALCDSLTVSNKFDTIKNLDTIYQNRKQSLNRITSWFNINRIGLVLSGAMAKFMGTEEEKEVSTIFGTKVTFSIKESIIKV